MRFLILIFVLFLGCEDDPVSPKNHDVTIKIHSYDSFVYTFGIFHNDDEIFQATECGSSNNNIELCVEFNSENIFEYDFVAETGDFIGILLNFEDACNAMAQAWIYIDGVREHGQIEYCGECYCSLLSVTYTIN